MLNSEKLSATRRIAEFIAYSSGIDRVTLGAELGLPMPTVIGTVKRLLDDGVIVETEDTVTRSVAGRRPRVLRRSGPASALGLIGWRDDALEAACYDFGGRLLGTQSLPAPDPRDAAAGLTAAVEVARGTAQRLGRELAAAVVSVPAPFLHGRGSPRAHLASDVPAPTFSVADDGDLEEILTGRYGLPVVMENDANLAALGELYAGAGKGCRNIVYVAINDQGLGSAVVVNGTLARGAHGFAGELAHLQLDRDGPLCPCGGRGCLWAHLKLLISQTAQAAHDEPVTYGYLSELAAAGDPGAARMLTDIGRTLGRPLAQLCTLLDPERLIVDNTLGPSVDHVLAGLRESIAVHAPPVIAHDLVLTTGTLGPAAEVLGAVEVLREQARRRT